MLVRGLVKFVIDVACLPFPALLAYSILATMHKYHFRGQYNVFPIAACADANIRLVAMEEWERVAT